MTKIVRFASFILFLQAVILSAQQPLIIDRAALFGDVEISEAQISPDGRYISFLRPYRGTENIWVKKTSESFNSAKPVSAESARPIQNYQWSKDSKFLLYTQDSGGDENFNLYAVSPSSPVDEKNGVPRPRAITQLKGVQTQIVASPRNQPAVIYIETNDRDSRWPDLYAVNLSTGTKTLVRENTDRISKWFLDDNGILKLVQRTTSTGDSEFARVDANDLTTIYSCSLLEDCYILGFNRDNKRVYLKTNKGSLDLGELESLDIATGETKTLAADPLSRGDLSDVTLSEKDHRILVIRFEDDRQRLYFRDKQFEHEYHALDAKVQGKVIELGTRSSDENLWIVNVESDTEPGETYLWNRAAHTLVLQYRIRDSLPRESLSSTIPFHFHSSDGLEIPGYLTLPKGLSSKNLPLVVFTHGGPWDEMNSGFIRGHSS